MREFYWEELTTPTLLPDAAPGATRLRSDLLPASTWGSNLRGILRWSAWRTLSYETSDEAGRVCEICGEQSYGPGGKDQRPDCHEFWSFESREGRLVQKLDRLIGLCKACHAVQHIGLAEIVGTLPQVLSTLQRVNDWDRAASQADVDRAFDRYDLMVTLDFDLDLSVLSGRILIEGHPSLLISASDRVKLGNSYYVGGKAEQPGKLGSPPALFGVGASVEDKKGGRG